MTATDLSRHVQRLGFVLHELSRNHGNRFLICDARGLVLHGTDTEPLTAEEVRRFLKRFDDPAWLPADPQGPSYGRHKQGRE